MEATNRFLGPLIFLLPFTHGFPAALNNDKAIFRNVFKFSGA
jgi:hypothetical protein